VPDRRGATLICIKLAPPAVTRVEAMTFVVRALPVLYACQGCPEYGQVAREVAALLERAGRVEAAWLGTPGLEPKRRFPIFALDGCERGCARRWLEDHGVAPERACVLP
jgi:uncharacterized metal-binding protein